MPALALPDRQHAGLKVPIDIEQPSASEMRSPPDELRESLRATTRMKLIRTLAAWRPDLSDYRNVVSAYKITLKSLGRCYLELHDEIADLDAMICVIVDELAPSLVARNSIGHESAAQLLLTAGDNSERVRSEASFAALCGASPGLPLARRHDIG